MDKKPKLSDLWTDAGGQIDEKRIVGLVMVINSLIWLWTKGNVGEALAMFGAGGGLFIGAVVADQGK